MTITCYNIFIRNFSRKQYILSDNFWWLTGAQAVLHSVVIILTEKKLNSISLGISDPLRTNVLVNGSLVR